VSAVQYREQGAGVDLDIKKLNGFQGKGIPLGNKMTRRGARGLHYFKETGGREWLLEEEAPSRNKENGGSEKRVCRLVCASYRSHGGKWLPIPRGG